MNRFAIGLVAGLCLSTAAAWAIDWTKPLITRDGRDARDLGLNGNGTQRHVEIDDNGTFIVTTRELDGTGGDPGTGDDIVPGALIKTILYQQNGRKELEFLARYSAGAGRVPLASAECAFIEGEFLP